MKEGFRKASRFTQVSLYFWLPSSFLPYEGRLQEVFMLQIGIPLRNTSIRLHA
jgi:hypothetical protein